MTKPHVTRPVGTVEYTISTSNSCHWPRSVRTYVNDCVAGTGGPRLQDVDLRWVGSLVAEAHRILMRGGISLCPANARDGCKQGLSSEAALIVFVIEQSGGHGWGAADSGCNDP